MGNQTTPALPALLQPQTNLFGNDAAAAYLGVTPRTLEVWRCTKRHQIPYIKVGRLVKYRPAVLDTWLAAQTVGAAE
jgi:excisionase family DNA binding protein